MLILIAGSIKSQVGTGNRHLQSGSLGSTSGRIDGAVPGVASPAQGPARQGKIGVAVLRLELDILDRGCHRNRCNVDIGLIYRQTEGKRVNLRQRVAKADPTTRRTWTGTRSREKSG